MTKGTFKETVLFGIFMIFGGKHKHKRGSVHSNSNVYVFPSNPDHDNFYLVSFDPMPPLWVSYAICARSDMVVQYTPSDMICLCRWSPPPHPDPCISLNRLEVGQYT